MSKKKELEIELKKENDKRKNSNKIGATFEQRIQKVLGTIAISKPTTILPLPSILHLRLLI